MVEAAARRIDLLLVENSDADADRLVSMLQLGAPSEFEAVRVVSTAQAVEHLGARRPDCVVVDLGLSDAEGLEVVERLAACAPGVALIVLTGRQDDELGVATIQTGASDYLAWGALDARLLARSVRFAILRKRFETSLAEAQSIAQVGSWEMDLATSAVTWSRELCRLFGFELTAKPTYEALIERTHPDDRLAATRAVRATLTEFVPFMVEHRLRLTDGTVRWVRGRGRIEIDAAGNPARLLGTAQDITEQKTADDALLHQALHDPLTGLPNRLLLLDRLGQALERLVRSPSTLAVIYFDIDRFQVINDSLGHAIGDQLLVAIASRLSRVVAPGDTLARAGGDEFVMVCEGLDGEVEAVGIADSACAALHLPLVSDGGERVLSLSAGVALATSALVGSESLLRDAEGAMFRAKEDGRSRSSVFAKTMRAESVVRLDTETCLRESVFGGGLRVHYQPIVTVADGRVVGHEALVRWEHPTRGLLGPDQFIGIAEDTGLIVPLGALVLDEACRQAKAFQGQHPAWGNLMMSVNLSGRQLEQPDLAERISAALHGSGLRPEDLQLEITESVLMKDTASTTTALRELKKLGVQLGIDDFGTGYSSLAYLKRFPVDVIKIDKSFVDGLGQEAQAAALVAAIVSLATALDLATVAEGVETPVQRDCLVDLGCPHAQGYLFARPAPASECEVLLDRALAGIC